MEARCTGQTLREYGVRRPTSELLSNFTKCDKLTPLCYRNPSACCRGWVGFGATKMAVLVPVLGPHCSGRVSHPSTQTDHSLIVLCFMLKHSNTQVHVMQTHPPTKETQRLFAWWSVASVQQLHLSKLSCCCDLAQSAFVI